VWRSTSAPPDAEDEDSGDEHPEREPFEQVVEGHRVPPDDMAIDLRLRIRSA
jgi:hypothetical protein